MLRDHATRFVTKRLMLHLPMLRHVAQPLHTRGLEADVGVEAAGDGAVDDGLLLLLQQC